MMSPSQQQPPVGKPRNSPESQSTPGATAAVAPIGWPALAQLLRSTADAPPDDTNTVDRAEITRAAQHPKAAQLLAAAAIDRLRSQVAPSNLFAFLEVDAADRRYKAFMAGRYTAEDRDGALDRLNTLQSIHGPAALAFGSILATVATAEEEFRKTYYNARDRPDLDALDDLETATSNPSHAVLTMLLSPSSFDRNSPQQAATNHALLLLRHMVRSAQAPVIEQAA